MAGLAACGDASGPRTPDFIAVSAGAFHTCALTTTGRAYCWGRNDRGALGTGDTVSRTTPAPVEGPYAFRAIAAGYLHTCAIREDGAAFCWGINGLGELGDGSRQDRLAPTAVWGGMDFLRISAGEGASCGVASPNGVSYGLYCWGTDLIGINAPAGRDSTRPALMMTGAFQDVSVGYEIACALASNGQAYCWGYGAKGQLGNGDSASSDIPVAVAQPMPFALISAGHDHACGGAVDGTVWCWGSNFNGRLGVTGPAMSAVPLLAAGGAVYDRVDAHTAGHTCALASGGLASCWGADGSGQLGDGSTSSGPDARPVAGGVHWRQLSGGFGHSCGIATDFRVYCWGDNARGQLGTGGGASTVPVPVAPPR